ncbi:MAG: DUF4097 family beta strand repeat protein [Ignavibacteriae bacterium]|nr:DUF4097 family beta strand repeat protein [Ignavibacteriota bacterium]
MNNRKLQIDMLRVFWLLLCLASVTFAEKYKTLEKRITTTPEQRIEIEGISGSKVHFKTWTNNEVYIKLRVSISSSDEEYENEYVSSATITESKSSDVVRLTFDADDEYQGKGFSLWKLFKRFYVNKEISGEIYVPKSNPLTTDLKYGTLTLEDMDGELNLNGVSNTLTLRRCTAIQTIENNYGKTTIEQSGGNLKLNGTSSTVSISDFNGKIHADADYSTVTISRVQQGVYVSDKSGKIKLEDIGGNASLDADYSSITVKNVKGFVDLNSTSATIRINNVDGISVDANYSDVDVIGVSGSSGKQISVKGQSGSLTLQDAVGNVVIDNPYANVELKNVKGNIELQSKSSQITASDVTGDWNSRTEYCSLKLRKVTSKNISMTNKSDGIELRLLNAPDTINIQNEYGSVSVRMPSGFSGNVDLDAEYGSVHTNLPLKRKSRSSNEYATGKVGSGNGSIIIETKSGDIEVEAGE